MDHVEQAKEHDRVPSDAPRKATLGDVAARAGVDRAVVSKVVNNDPKLHIRQATRQRVLQAIDELGYRTNASARSLRTARAGAFGLVIPEFSNPVYAAVIYGAQLAAARHRSLLFTASSLDGNFDAEDYVDLLAPGRLDGVLLADVQASERTIERLRMLDLPWIALNQRHPAVRRSIILDDERAAMLAVQHLVDLGHRRIAHITGQAGAETAAGRRRAGYLAALAAAGLEGDRGLLAQTDLTNAGGAAATRALLSGPAPPTAIFVVNISMAIGALRAVRQAGRVVPDDVSIIAVHDLPLADYLEPPLTTIRMPLEALGQRGVELLATASAAGTIEEIIAGPIALVMRRSTAPPQPDARG